MDVAMHRAEIARRLWSWETRVDDTVRIRGQHDGLVWSLFSDVHGFDPADTLLICTRDAASLASLHLGRTGAMLRMFAASARRRTISFDLRMLALAPRIDAEDEYVRGAFVIAGSAKLATPDLETALRRWIAIQNCHPSERDSLIIRVHGGTASIDGSIVQRSAALGVLTDITRALVDARAPLTNHTDHSQALRA